MNEIETTIRGGFPLRIKYTLNPSEPDVGIMAPYAEVYEILTPAGKSAEFLNITDAEMTEIEEACDTHAWDNEYDERY